MKFSVKQSNTFTDDFNRVENFKRTPSRIVPSVLENEIEEPIQAWTPIINIADQKDKIVMRVEFPGVKKEDLEVTIENNVLTISGEKQQNTEEKDKDMVSAEHFSENFIRAFNLSPKIDSRNIKVYHKNGLLELALPKK